MGKKKDYRELLKTPFDTGIRNFSAVARYFLYYAPDIDSAQSPGIIPYEKAESLLSELLKKTGLEGSARFLYRIQPSSWKKNDLDGFELDFEQQRFLCDKYKTETELHALLRHIRNALAHGYVFVWKKKTGNYVFFTDYDSGKNRFTAKIMVSMSILEQWKAILENEIL